MQTAVVKCQEKRQAIDAQRLHHRKRLAGVPQLTGRDVREQGRALQKPLPRSKNFVDSLSADLILCIREFLGHGLSELLPLMLCSKTSYRSIGGEKVINQAIAKDIFGFSYLSSFYNNIYTYRDILAFRDHASGHLLHYRETDTVQFLGNARLRSKEPYVYWMKMVVYEYGGPDDKKILKCVGRSKEVLCLKQLFSDFEESHNAIRIKMYRPYFMCYPIKTFSNAVSIHVSDNDELEEACQGFAQGQKVIVGVRLSLQISVVYYRFLLVLEHIRPCP